MTPYLFCLVHAAAHLAGDLTDEDDELEAALGQLQPIYPPPSSPRTSVAQAAHPSPSRTPVSGERPASTLHTL